MAPTQALPEPMNASPHHSKVKISTTLANPTFVAGTYVSGKVEMECRADRGLGIGIMMVELFAIQELNSRDHSATSTFLHSRRLFQGPGLPPSNAVQARPMPGDPPLPQHYYQARRGRSTFVFRIPLPTSCPSTISFGSGLAKVRYELRASVGVFWKSEKRLVVDNHSVDIVEAYPLEDNYLAKLPEAVAVGEGGKLWMQGRIMSNVIVAGESACLELQVKNHSQKKNSGLTLSLTRTLYLPGSSSGQHPVPVHISDTLTTVPFRGPEYVITPGAEGVANLVFDVPIHARGVRGGTLDGEESETGGGRRHSDSLFEIRCKVEVKLSLGMGSKDVILEVPIEIVHPSAMPLPQQPPQQPRPSYPPIAPPGIPHPQHVLAHPTGYYPEPVHYYQPPATSPMPLQLPYLDPSQNQVWIPPIAPIPAPHMAPGYPYLPPMHQEQYSAPISPFSHPQYHDSVSPPLQNYLIPPVHPGGYLARPSSAGAIAAPSQLAPPMIPGLPVQSSLASLLPLNDISHPKAINAQPYEPESGKGERALRVSQHLRMSSRTRSVSPQSHRYPLPIPPTIPAIPEVQPQPMSMPFIATPSQPLPVRSLPAPPGLTPNGNLSASSAGPSKNVVHSPRPHLTPKQSFTRDPVLGSVAKSERVEELEKMADHVMRKSMDLSADLPKGFEESLKLIQAQQEAEKAKKEAEATKEAEVVVVPAEVQPTESDPNINKTLPGPPVPSQKGYRSPPPLTGGLSRARADLYFSPENDEMKETAPVPCDQTPPTPALVAIPSRLMRHDKSDKNELKTESGFDALERRLLAEVGTRKVDVRDQRPDARQLIAPIDTELAQARSSAIPIPVKSPEPLNDSAISSLTLAGGLAGDESDGEFDGRTHRAGRSRSPSPIDDREVLNGLHMHMRERAQGSTPTTRVGRKEKEKDAGKESKSSKSDDKKKEKANGGKKKEKTSGEKGKSKTAAKGRVAAWLGGIDPAEPPQEEIIPPSPSVIREDGRITAWFGGVQLLEDEDNPRSPLAQATTLPFDEDISSSPPPDRAKTPAAEPSVLDVSASPNPRSSGFVPIATLKRETIQERPIIARDATVVVEARKVQNIWASVDSSPVPVPEADVVTPRAPFAIPGIGHPTSVRTNRKVSPPSKPSIPGPSNQPQKPLSYSAVARNVRRVVDPKVNGVSGAQPPSNPPSAPPVPPLSNKVPGPTGGIAKRFPAFPPPKPVDPEVKYDIRSARGGRGGKVTTVANLWSSGAIHNQNAAKAQKEIPKRLDAVKETSSALSNGSAVPMTVISPPPSPPPLPAKPAQPEKMSFSAALKTPPRSRQVSKQPPPLPGDFGQRVNPAQLTDAQKRPDSRHLFSASKSTPTPGNAIPPRPTVLSPTKLPARPRVVPPGLASKSTEALIQKRPSTSPYLLPRKAAPSTTLSTPSSTETKLPELAKGVMPATKGTSDPVVSSSHAIPTLSTTASLARPRSAASSNAAANKFAKAAAAPKLPLIPSTLTTPAILNPGVTSDAPRPASPTKPLDLVFGQARLRDLIKKYQG